MVINQAKYISPILSIIIILIFSVTLFKNLNYVQVPNSDFFEYINEGSQYIKLKLPDSIEIPPLSPMLICLISKIFRPVEYPQLLTAHLINIICSTLSLANIYLIFNKKNKPWIGLATILLLSTNKIYITTSLNITSEIPYVYLITLTILTYSQKKYKLSYLLSGLAFLFRYEAIVLPIIIFSLEFFKKTKRFKFSNLLIAFLPIILWLIVLNFHNKEGIFQNHYINEIIAGKNNIPNLQPTNSLLDVIVSNPINYFLYYTFHLKNYPTLPSKITNIIFPAAIFILCLIKIIPKKNSVTNKIIFSTLLAHVLFISVFPNFSPRYLTPILWIIYLTIIDRRNKIISVLLVTSLLIINLKTINNYSPYNMAYEKSESRLIANWIKQQKFKTITNIITYEPYVIEYFIEPNSYIKFDSWWNHNELLKNCDDNTLCFLNGVSNSEKEKTQFFFITTSYSSPNDISTLDDQYLVNTTHMRAFQDKNIDINDKQLKLINELKENDYHWAKIYQYQQ